MCSLQILKSTIEMLIEINQEVQDGGNDFKSSYLSTQNETYNRVINIIDTWEANENESINQAN